MFTNQGGRHLNQHDVLTAATDLALELDGPRQARRLARWITGESDRAALARKVRGQRILVTGASAGVGKYVAERLVEAGAEVILVARRLDLLDAIVEASATEPGSAHAYACDLSDEEQVTGLAKQVIANHGRVDILINNAGRSIRRSLAETTDRLHDFDRVMRLNFFGVVWLTAPLVERMRTSGGGQVVNVSTMGTQLAGTPRFTAYMASKGALDQFTRSAAAETRADGVRWTTVHLPLVQTDMIAPAQAAWKLHPKLSLEAGASMVLDAVLRAPTRVTTPMGNVAEVIDRYATWATESIKSREFPRTDPAPLPRVAIVGAGMSGIAVALRLQRESGARFTIFEKADQVGGTWRENTYPGLACDVPAHYYCFRDRLDATWSKLFAPGAEIRDYFERVVSDAGLEADLRFGVEIVAARFEQGQWILTDQDGAEETADVLVCATGVLHHPREPAIEGLQTFEGAVFHSARWNHQVPLEGARIGIVGSGSTGVQLTSALAGVASKLTLFQRTPQWVVPVPNPSIPRLIREGLARIPLLDRAAYTVAAEVFNRLALAPIQAGPERVLLNAVARRGLRKIRDPRLRARMTPADEPMCKRLVMSGTFHGAVQQPNVAVINEEILKASTTGLVTVDGEEHELDVLVLATGFDAHAYMRPMHVAGRGGETISQAWSNGPRAHLATTVPGFPNLFLMMGPNSPVGNASLVPIAEVQADYIASWLLLMRDRGISEIEPTPTATSRFYEDVKDALPGTVWVSGCESWYLDASGNPVLWPWSLSEYRARLSKPNLDDFTLRTPDGTLVGR